VVCCASLALAWLAVACSGRHGLRTIGDPDGGAAPDATTAALCSVSTTQEPPFAVQFTFRGVGAGPTYIREVCGSVDFGVSSCASGYARKLGPVSSLGTCECGVVPCSPPIGGPCEPNAAVALTGGATANAAWGNTSVELEWNGTTLCSRTATLPAGRYRVAIRAYDTPEDAARGVRGWVVTHDFDLPTPGGVVDVPVGARAVQPCETAAASAPSTCTGHEGRETACDLPDNVTFSWEGGELSSYYDTFELGPPASFSITRVSNAIGVPPPAPCATAIPRCSGDARVITTSDLVRVLSEPSIAAAFSSPPTAFGTLKGLIDHLEVRRADGAAISIGGACAPPELPCERPLTPAAFAVKEAFRLLQDQRSADGCVEYYPY
jgi:hypothetical protein